MKVLKLSAPFIISPLTYICNKSHSAGVFPERLKYAVIKPVYKKGDELLTTIYRPICLLTSFSKIFEKLIYSRLYRHIAKILRRRIEKKIEDVLGEDQFGFRRGEGTRDAIGMLRISEWTLEMDEELCVCLIDWQKVFYRVNWTKLMQILRELVLTGVKEA